MLIKPGRLFGHLISYLWLACVMECVRAVCTCHSLHTVCFLVCALFWLQGCWRCPIMSSIIPPVNMAKSSCPWEKLWKGECQYWQTNKFWQRGQLLGDRSTLQTWACRHELWSRCQMRLAVICFRLLDVIYCYVYTKEIHTWEHTVPK